MIEYFELILKPGIVRALQYRNGMSRAASSFHSGNNAIKHRSAASLIPYRVVQSVSMRFSSTGSAAPPPNAENSPPTTESTSQKLSIDAFLQNIHARGKVKSDRLIINQARDKARKYVQPVRTGFQRGSIISSLSTGRTTESSERPTERSIQPKLDAEAVFSDFQKHDDAGTCPDLHYILRGAGACAEAGHVEGVALCQKLLAEHAEDVFQQNMRLNISMANALWAANRWDESMKLFKETFYDFPLNRRKITDKFRLSLLRALRDYPCPEQMTLLRDFGDYCLSFRDTMPLVHLWQGLFRHASPRANEEAFQLMQQHPTMKKLVIPKLDPLLRQARELRNSGVLFRMLPLIDVLELPQVDVKHWKGCVFDALMDIYCDSADVNGAKDLLRLAKESATAGKVDYMWPETVKKYVTMSGLTRVRVPGGESGAALPRLNEPATRPPVPKLSF
ncbi:hypothetical protein BV898_01585 [Hypsibius exemplaris]|uniref:Uncharacterized protein n=1 Tax=Hypsibius exemplaris TaxID=2072580 RepID=A0A1W0XAK4_HYPEX|nr:hypothetical protein BV898_01585 [Hypsibius exemplaris]